MALYWSSEKTRERYQCHACGGWFSSHKLKCPRRPRSVWDETPTPPAPTGQGVDDEKAE